MATFPFRSSYSPTASSIRFLWYKPGSLLPFSFALLIQPLTSSALSLYFCVAVCVLSLIIYSSLNRVIATSPTGVLRLALPHTFMYSVQPTVCALQSICVIETGILVRFCENVIKHEESERSSEPCRGTSRRHLICTSCSWIVMIKLHLQMKKTNHSNAALLPQIHNQFTEYFIFLKPIQTFFWGHCAGCSHATWTYIGGGRIFDVVQLLCA